MAEVKWIKLSTSMFDDEKIKLIEKMPDSDTILVIWLKLLAQAGKTNSSGYIFLSENIPYTDEMLATIFDRPISTIRLALETFEQLGMIGIDDNSFISITNWQKHQNVEGLDKIREQTRKRVAKHREKQKELPNEDNSNVDVTLRNATEGELEEDKNKNRKEIKEIIAYLNSSSGKSFKTSTKKTKDSINARLNDGFDIEDFKRVIDNKVSEWSNDTKMNKFIRPETLFGNKFEGYLNQQTSIPKHKKINTDWMDE